MPDRCDARPWIRREIRPQPRLLWRPGSAAADRGTVRVQAVHPPGADVVRIPALTRRPCPRTEVAEIGGSSRGLIFMVARDRTGPALEPAPHRVVAVRVL